MQITILTLFPDIFPDFLNFSILKRAQEKKLFSYQVINIRDFGEGKHQIVDDKPFGGGAGMVLKADVLTKALKSIKYDPSTTRIIMTSASGRLFNQETAQELSKVDHIIIICGHYEGVDERFVKKYITDELSIGDFVLTGGEIPALLLIDSITRLIPGVLNKESSLTEESFNNGLLEYPQYTRPELFEDEKVPDVLLSGNHQKIDEYRQQQSQEKTQKNRPDLLKK